MGTYADLLQDPEEPGRRRQSGSGLYDDLFEEPAAPREPTRGYPRMPLPDPRAGALIGRTLVRGARDVAED